MKTYIYAALFALLIVAAGLNFKPKPPAGSKPAAEVVSTPAKESAAAVPESGPRPTPSPPAAPKPRAWEFSPERITAIVVSAPDGGEVKLTALGGTWLVDGDSPAPADKKLIERLFADLLAHPGERVENGSGAVTLDGGAARLRLYAGNDAPALDLGIGQHLDDFYSSVLVDAGDGLFRVYADLRGDLGLWGGSGSASLSPDFWRDLSIANFAADQAVRIDVERPDHALTLARSGDGAWSLEKGGYGEPIGQAGVGRWLNALSRLAAAAIAKPGEDGGYGLNEPTHRLKAVLEDGSAIEIAAAVSRDGMAYVKSTARPGAIYSLDPGRLDVIFPAGPGLFGFMDRDFPVTDIRFVDIRRGRENLKLARKGDVWNAPGARHPLNQGRVAAWINAIAGWSPQSYLDPDTAPRMPLGAPEIEVSLAGGDVEHYRLGPPLPDTSLRLLLADGKYVLVAGDEDTAALFPEYSNLFQLGDFFADLGAAGVDGMKVEWIGGSGAAERRGLDLVLGRDGFWAMRNNDGTKEGAEKTGGDLHEKAARLVDQALKWKPAGIYGLSDDIFTSDEAVTVTVSAGGTSRAITFVPSPAGVSPALRPDGAALWLDDPGIFSWVEAAQTLEAGDETDASPTEDGATADSAGESPPPANR